MTMKKHCKACGEEKELREFPDGSANNKHGKLPRCTPCHRAWVRERYHKNKGAHKKRMDKYMSSGGKEKKRQRYLDNKDQILEQNKKYRQTEAYKARDRERKNTPEYKEYMKQYNKMYREENKEKIREMKRVYKNKRRREDPEYKLRTHVSREVLRALKGGLKCKSTWEALPYTPKELKEHLEAQFDSQMTWENHGSYWHIDHIYPQSLLPFESLNEDNFYKCWSLDNLQPLEASRNIKKSNKVDGDEE